METLKIKIVESKRGIPCLWERGGGYSNTGEARLICDNKGFAKKPLYIKRKGELACNEHALIPVKVGDMVIYAYHHRKDFKIEVYSISQIQCEEAQLTIINLFSNGEWDNDKDYWHESPVVKAAMDKATCYHCREPYFIKDE